MQLMDDDDPGPNMPSGLTDKTHVEPTGPVVPDATHDILTAGSNDAVATFANINLKGNFYNSTRGGIVQGPFGPPSSASKNLGLTFDDASITGVITASTAVHAQSTIGAADYRLLGEVTDTPAKAVNNGVIVNLTDDSKWIVTGTCYLTSLTLDDDAAVLARFGHTITMTDDGTVTAIVPGNTYTGNIVLTIN